MRRGCELANAKKNNYDIKMAFYTPLVCLSLVLYPSGRQWHANRPKFACDWQPLLYNLYATVGHSGTICMRLAATRIQTLHALAASCVQSQCFTSMLREQLFELKN
jgi:hypothetical protein